MAFNSISFLIFFTIVYFLYLIIKTHKTQNKLLLLASYYFYASWDWRFLSLIFISTVTDYFCALKMEKCKFRNEKKIFITISIIVNLGILAIFKYFNFFVESFCDLVELFGVNCNFTLFRILLPVGISFYTFQNNELFYRCL